MVQRIASSDELHPLGFSRERFVLRIFPFSRAHLWAKVKAGAFPAPVKLSVGVTAWRNSDLLAEIAKFNGEEK